MGETETFLLITGIVLGAIGSLFLAMLHGLGYNVFGLKDEKPGFWRRFLFQIGSIAVAYVLYYLIGELLIASFLNASTETSLSILTRLAELARLTAESGLNGGAMIVFIFAILMAIVYHISLGAATYLLGSKSIAVAIKTPSICSLVILLITVLPGILNNYAN